MSSASRKLTLRNKGFLFTKIFLYLI